MAQNIGETPVDWIVTYWVVYCLGDDTLIDADVAELLVLELGLGVKREKAVREFLGQKGNLAIQLLILLLYLIQHSFCQRSVFHFGY